MRRQTMVHGAMVLALAGLASRALGGVYRIILPRFVGAEAIGLFQMAYPIYNVFLIVSVSGLPLAISRLVAERQALGSRREAMRTFHIAMGILTVGGLLCTGALYFGAEWLGATLLGDTGAIPVIRAVAPSVLFLSLISGWRGLFQGLHDMVPGGVAQVVEQLARVLATLGLALYLKPAGVEMAAAGASAGAVVGSVLGLAVLLWYWGRSRREYLKGLAPVAHRPAEPAWVVVRDLYALAIPIVLGALVIPLTLSIDAAIVPRQLLNLGYNTEMARVQYGRLSGMAMTLAYFPPSLLYGVGVALVPAIAEALARRRRDEVRRKIEESLWLTVVIALPASVGLYVLAGPLCELLFKDPAAGPPLAVLSSSALLISLQGTTVGILQGLNHPVDPVRYLAVGAVVKTALCYYLTGLPTLGILGAALASVIGFLVAAGGNLAAVVRWTGYRPDWWKVLLLPGLASALMALAVRSAYVGLAAAGMFLFDEPSLAWCTLGSIAVGVAVYGAALWVGGGFPPDLMARLSAKRS